MKNMTKKLSSNNNSTDYFLYLLIIGLSVFYIVPVVNSKEILYSSFADDFFYYLKIAKNYYEGHGFSFAAGYETNGFQPIHQGIILLLYYLSQSFNLDVLVLIRLSFGIIFFSSCLLLYGLIKPATIYSVVIFSLSIFFYFFISVSGMESLLVCPLACVVILLICKNAINPFLAAFLFGALYLVRIDSIVIVLPILIYYALKSNIALVTFLPRVGKMLFLYFIPIIIYSVFSYTRFKLIFPVSGLAKSVIKMNGLHFATFSSMFSFGLIITILVLLTVATVFVSLIKRFQMVLFLLAGSTLFFYVQTSVRSDWGIWQWYLYPFCILLFITGYNFEGFSSIHFKPFFQKIFRVISYFLILCCFFSVLLYTFPFQPSTINLAAFKIFEFSKNHPGNYAMGDRAGVVGYLTCSRVVQLEGLVMDKAFLNNLTNKKNLKDLMDTYNVSYYIATNPKKVGDSTYIVREPSQSGRDSRNLTDTISWNIALEFKTVNRKRFMKKDSTIVNTVIFKVPEL